MDIQQHFCPHQLWKKRAEDKKVRHVVHMDGNISLPETKKGGFEQTPYEKLQIRQHVSESSATLIPELINIYQPNSPIFFNIWNNRVSKTDDVHLKSAS